MNNKDVMMMMMVVEAVANEKGLPKDVVVSIVEESLATAVKKQLGNKDIVVQVSINPKTGDYKSYKYYTDDKALLEEYGLFRKIPVELLTKEEVPNISFSRIAAQTAKHTIHQKIKDAEKKQQIEHMKKRIGQMISGTVKKVYPDVLHINGYDDINFYLPREKMLLNENYRVGDRVRAILDDIKYSAKGNQYILSRTSNKMLEELLNMEVPEISQGIIRIKSIVREPGVRAKVAVKSNDKRIDSVGACIGMHGIRIQAVSNALANERVDIAEWSDDMAQLVINLMSPINITSLIVNEGNQTIEVIVPEDLYPQAIGKGGSNITLTSKICGWKIDVLTEDEASVKKQKEFDKYIEKFEEQLSVDRNIAEKIAMMDIFSVEELAFVSLEDLVDIGLSHEMAENVRNIANDALLMQQLSEHLHNQVEEADNSLKNIEGISPDIIKKLVESGIKNSEDLANLSTEELIEIIPDIEQERAETFIMEARRPWFE